MPSQTERDLKGSWVREFSRTYISTICWLIRSLAACVKRRKLQRKSYRTTRTRNIPWLKMQPVLWNGAGQKAPQNLLSEKTNIDEPENEVWEETRKTLSIPQFFLVLFQFF